MLSRAVQKMNDQSKDVLLGGGFGWGGKRTSDADELSAAEWVRQQVFDDILSGRLLPGEKLSEVHVARRLGCSRTPVREAFRHLGALGLIQFEKNRGVKVARLGRDAMLALFDATAELESACADLAARRLTALERKRLVLCSAEPVGRDGGEAALYALLHGAAGNPVLAELAQMVHQRLAPYWRLTGGGAEEWRRVGAEAKSRVVEAVVAGDGTRARAAMRAYVLAARAIAERSLALP